MHIFVHRRQKIIYDLIDPQRKDIKIEDRVEHIARPNTYT